MPKGVAHTDKSKFEVLLIYKSASSFLGSNSGKQSKKKSHSSQQHSKPCSPLPRQTSGFPGVRTTPVTSITFSGISLSIPYILLSTYKKCAPKGRTEKMLPPQLLSHELISRRNEKGEKTLFTKKVFPRREKVFNSCDKYILPHFCRIVNNA